MSGNLPINWVTQLNLHCSQLRMMFIMAFAKGEATAVVLLDQSAAFDTIDHDMLLNSLLS